MLGGSDGKTYSCYSVHDPGLTTFCTCKLDAKVKFTRKPSWLKTPIRAQVQMASVREKIINSEELICINLHLMGSFFKGIYNKLNKLII